MYVVMILVDGQRIACNRRATLTDVVFLCELAGPDLELFERTLSSTGQAMNVRNDGYGTVVTIAHEEI